MRLPVDDFQSDKTSVAEFRALAPVGKTITTDLVLEMGIEAPHDRFRSTFAHQDVLPRHSEHLSRKTVQSDGDGCRRWSIDGENPDGEADQQGNGSDDNHASEANAPEVLGARPLSPVTLLFP